MYIKTGFVDFSRAKLWMEMKNQTAADNTVYVVIDGPEDDWAVVDLKTAGDIGGQIWF